MEARPRSATARPRARTATARRPHSPWVGSSERRVPPAAGSAHRYGLEHRAAQGLDRPAALKSHERYPDLPLAITENGAAFDDELTPDGRVHDAEPAWPTCHDHIDAVGRGHRQRGADVRGCSVLVAHGQLRVVVRLLEAVRHRARRLRLTGADVEGQCALVSRPGRPLERSAAITRALDFAGWTYRRAGRDRVLTGRVRPVSRRTDCARYVRRHLAPHVVSVSAAHHAVANPDSAAPGLDPGADPDGVRRRWTAARRGPR